MQRIIFSNTGWNNIRPHIIFWSLFIIYELGINYSFSGGHFSTSLLEVITLYPINISLFYLHSFTLSHFSKDNEPRYFVIAIVTLLEIAVYLAVKFMLYYLYLTLGIYGPEKHEEFSRFLINSSWRAGYFIVISSAFAFGRISVLSIRKINELDSKLLAEHLNKEILARELLLTENAYLKAQINPHFMFNMLSYIHNQISEYSESLGNVVITLANMMRYAFSDADENGKVALSMEVEHVENYIALSQNRFNNTLQIRLTAVGVTPQTKIAPMVLLTLVENVFKYGELSEPENPAVISINVTDNEFRLKIHNALGKRRRFPSNGVGISNVKLRLKQLYPERHILNIIQEENYYELNLTLNLSND